MSALLKRYAKHGRHQNRFVVLRDYTGTARCSDGFVVAVINYMIRAETRRIPLTWCGANLQRAAAVLPLHRRPLPCWATGWKLPLPTWGSILLPHAPFRSTKAERAETPAAENPENKR